MNLGWLLRWWDGRRCRWCWWWGERRRLRWREGGVIVEVLLERPPGSEELLVSWREGDGRPAGPYRFRAGPVPLLLGGAGRIEVAPVRARWLALLGLLVGVWFLWPLVTTLGDEAVAQRGPSRHLAAEAGSTPQGTPPFSGAELRARARATERAAYYRPGALAESIALWRRIAAQGGSEAATAAAHAKRLARELAVRIAALEGAVRWAERTRRWRTVSRLAARMRLEAPAGTPARRWAERRLGDARREVRW